MVGNIFIVMIFVFNVRMILVLCGINIIGGFYGNFDNEINILLVMRLNIIKE